MDASSIQDDDVVYYVAVSLDGFIADAEGGVKWLEPYFVPELGFHTFIARVGSVIMGRKTFDQVLGFGKWPYKGKSGTIVTHRELPESDADLTAATGSPAEILQAASAHGTGPWWIVGGADLAGQMVLAGAITRIEWFVIPELLGAGVPAINLERTTGLELSDTQEYPKGIVRLGYRPRLSP